MSVQETYNAIAKDFSATRTQAWGEFEEFRKYIKAGAKVLDIGCGNGRLYETFLKDMDIDYSGVDLSENLLEEAKKKHPNQKFFHDDMTRLDSLRGQTFDVIFFIASFHHLNNKKDRITTLKRVSELLKKDGVICMINWNLFQKRYRKYVWKAFWKSLFSHYKWNDTFIPFTKENLTVERYYHAFTPGELHSLFTSNGYTIIEGFAYSKDRRIKHWWKSRNICHVIKKS